MARVSSIDPSGYFDYSYAYIHWVNIEYLLLKGHHGDILYFPTQRVNSKNSKKLAFTQYNVF